MKATDNRERVARFIDKVVRAAAQSPEDVPKVYRDLFLDVLFVLPPHNLVKIVQELSRNYNENMPEIVVPEWGEDQEIPF